MFTEAEVHADQAFIAGDAVAFVDDRVAHLEFGKIVQPVVEAGLACGFAPGAARAAGEQFGFGDESQPV